jgi:hypothetical protein
MTHVGSQRHKKQTKNPLVGYSHNCITMHLFLNVKSMVATFSPITGLIKRNKEFVLIVTELPGNVSNVKVMFVSQLHGAESVSLI